MSIFHIRARARARNRARSGGFSLVELIVVIALLGVAMTLGTVTLGRMMGYWQVARAAAELDAKATYAFDQMRQDLASVPSRCVNEVPLQGASEDARAPQFWRIELASDSMVVPAQLPTSPGGPLRAARVEYRIDRKDSPALVRIVGDLKGALPKEGVLVAEGVLELRIEYADGVPGAQWVSSWTEKTLPRAVRVTLVMADPDRPTTQLVRQAVFPINVG